MESRGVILTAGAVQRIPVEPRYGGGNRVVMPREAPAHGGMILLPAGRLAYWAFSLDAQLTAPPPEVPTVNLA